MARKIVKMTLAALLVFFVAAPMIVGVYDAANLRTNGSSEAALGSIVEQSGLERGERHTHDADAALRDGSRYCAQDGEVALEAAENEKSCSIADWYSGDPSASDSLGNGGARLAYEFHDGTVVDFGNPYILDWSDVQKPDDYDQVVDGPAASSIFAPEKAYAGPISWLTGKLKYLAIKSGYWKSLGSIFYSLVVSSMVSFGVTSTAAAQYADEFMAELPAITRVISSDSVAFSTEDTAMLALDALFDVASQKVAVSEFPAALDAAIAADVTSVETTGMLSGGASGNFVNAMYQLAATAGVPASMLFSDIGLYIGSWLGGNFDDYFNDAPVVDADAISHLDFCGFDIPLRVTSDDLSAGGYHSLGEKLVARTKDPINGYYYGVMMEQTSGTCNFTVGYFNGGTSMAANTWLFTDDYKCHQTRARVNNGLVGRWESYIWGSPYEKWSTMIYSPNVKVSFRDNESHYVYGTFDASIPKWTGDAEAGAGEARPFDGQIVGQDAQVDGSGSVVDYGNVKVNDVTAGDYQAPTTWQGALDQMGAAAIEQGATSTDQIVGQPGTNIGDWVGRNQAPATPADPSGPSGKDDFKVSDLEKVFPFCIPWDIYYLLSALNADPVAPDFVWTFDFAALGRYDLEVDLSPWDGAANVARTCEALLFCVGLALVTRDLIRG